MKLGNKDFVEEVYYTQNGVEHPIEYKGKNLELNKIKAGKRDTKGVKPRT
jgi:DNA gyrase subunit A